MPIALNQDIAGRAPFRDKRQGGGNPENVREEMREVLEEQPQEGFPAKLLNLIGTKFRQTARPRPVPVRLGRSARWPSLLMVSEVFPEVTRLVPSQARTSTA